MTRLSGNMARRHRRFLAVVAMGLMLAGVGAPDARAQAMVGGLSGGYSANANKPIDITADVLEVDDKRKLAIFKGSVSATQGDFNMKAQELIVNYTVGGQKNGKPAKAGALPGGGNGEIKEIRAQGNVVLITKDNQEARSDLAVFDVKAQLVTMLGNVRLARGHDNIIKGGKVEINLVEGTTVIKDAGQGSGAGSGRISATFTPSVAKEK